MNYQRLENHLVEMIKEQQIKLGYVEEEEIRLYYPLSLLNRLLGVDEDNIIMGSVLEKFQNQIKDTLGEINISQQNSRICFVIPPKGNRYVKEHVKDNPFLENLIMTVQRENVSMEEIIQVFKQTGLALKIQKIQDGECDYQIQFLEGEPYCYHLKEEGGHITYHRFLNLN